MEPAARAVTWEAPKHHHVEKGNDWFFALAIIVVCMVIAAILFNNVMLALLLVLAGGALGVAAANRPSIIQFSVSVRGIKIDDRLYPFSTLASYHIDEDDHRGPQLLIKSERHIMPLLILPLPPGHIDDIESILKEKLPEEELEESLFVKILELFGV